MLSVARSHDSCGRELSEILNVKDSTKPELGDWTMTLARRHQQANRQWNSSARIRVT
jgi:hypothetical protein